MNTNFGGKMAVDKFLRDSLSTCMYRFDSSIKIKNVINVENYRDLAISSNKEVVNSFGLSVRKHYNTILTLAMEMYPSQLEQFDALLRLYHNRLHNILNSRGVEDEEDYYLSITENILQDLKNYKEERDAHPEPIPGRLTYELLQRRTAEIGEELTGLYLLCDSAQQRLLEDYIGKLFDNIKILRSHNFITNTTAGVDNGERCKWTFHAEKRMNGKRWYSTSCGHEMPIYPDNRLFITTCQWCKKIIDSKGIKI